MKGSFNKSLVTTRVQIQEKAQVWEHSKASGYQTLSKAHTGQNALIHC